MHIDTRDLGRAPLALLTLLGAALCVPASASAQRLNADKRPSFGLRNVAPGFAPDPIQVAVVSGGPLSVNSMTLGPGCGGFATAQPGFNFRLTATTAMLRVFVEAGTDDTTLIINRPDGTWACNDDSNGGTNPTVDLANATAGLYNVWIGSYRSGETAHGTLNLTQRADLHPSSPSSSQSSSSPTPPDVPDPELDDDDVFVMPGAIAVVFAPAAPGSSAFFGGGFQFAPVQFTHNTDAFGPSQVALIGQVSLLRSASSDATMVLYETGITLSFERNAGRRFFIPFFGFTLGGLAHAELRNTAFFYPMVGVNIVWDKHLTASLEGGYHIPFTRVDELRGFRAQLSVRFSVW